MRAAILLASFALSLAACARDEIASENDVTADVANTHPSGIANPQPTGGGAEPAVPGWDLQSSGEGAALALLGPGGRTVVRLFCPAATNRLIVNVPAFRPVGSEERMTFGSGGEAAVLAADSRGDSERGGASGTGAVPDNLPGLIRGPVAVNYGSQNSGPHPAPPTEAVRAFAGACSETPPAEPGPPPEPPVNEAAAGACRMQDGKAIPANLIKAVGTEPFWAARIDGRCVTYMTPEDQKGTRIWTQFTGSREQGVWTGFYANQRFVLSTRPQAGCSDGMSDRRYPLAVSLAVAGEQRTGCAE
jgi:uncharacterized membrane protein